MFRLTLYCLLFVISLSAPALAQNAVTLRIGVHDDYTRAVFDWPSMASYDIRKMDDDTISISFRNSAALTFDDAAYDEASSIKHIRTVSPIGQPLQVEIDIIPGSDFRHFLVGSRMVVDVYNAEHNNTPRKPEAVSETVNTAVSVAATAPIAPQAKPPIKPSVKPSTKPLAQPKPEAISQPQDVTIAPPLPETTPPTDVKDEGAESAANTDDAAITEPHMITVTSTENTGMAAYIRNGNLWIMLDRPNVTVPPQVTGQQAVLFGAPQRYNITRHNVNDGTAFVIKLPRADDYDLNFYGEGGSLVWRIIVTPHSRVVTPLPLMREFDRMHPERGGILVWITDSVGKIMDFVDPHIGDNVRIVTVNRADRFGGPQKTMVDLVQLESVVGLAIVPKVDDLEIEVTAEGIAVTRDNGLAVSRQSDVSRKLIRREAQETPSYAMLAQSGDTDMRRIFDFDRWTLGGVHNLSETQRILLSDLSGKDVNGRAQDLLTLAKMYLANGRGHEALGFLNFAISDVADLADSPEFIAMRGAASAIAGQYERAFRDVFHPLLQDYDEMDYWRSYVLAWLEDWRQAVAVMPDDFTVLLSYPKPLLERLGLKLAEVALRDGKVVTAEAVLDVLKKSRDAQPLWIASALDYLTGEASRQKGDYEQAETLWSGLAQGRDDWHRVKAGLALTLLELNEGDITSDGAIDNLEKLRYAWRGDELETQISYVLGRLYLERGEYLKGFGILRESITMSPDSDIAHEIAAYMKQEYKDLLIKDKTLDPLQAVEIYEEFKELTPTDDEGNIVMQVLAERLVEADLLDRAAYLLQHQIDYRLEEADKARVAVRLGTIYLLNGNARQALGSLNTGRNIYAAILEGDERTQKLQEVDMLRARAYSQLNRTAQAIDILNKLPVSPNVNKLRADIAWQAGLWDDAGEALHDLILDAGIDPERPLSDDNAALILNYAVALNLSGNRVELANVGKRYGASMAGTNRAHLFNVVTRQRQNSILADRETIEAIVSEVDIFSDFLESYKNTAAIPAGTDPVSQ